MVPGPRLSARREPLAPPASPPLLKRGKVCPPLHGFKSTSCVCRILISTAGVAVYAVATTGRDFSQGCVLLQNRISILPFLYSSFDLPCPFL